jgi:colanic acid/amylovoran biosynthesis glycosyltransferase
MLSYLIKHPEIWQEMGSSGRACVEKHYDINKLNDELVEIYHQVTTNNLQSQESLYALVNPKSASFS